MTFSLNYLEQHLFFLLTLLMLAISNCSIHSKTPKEVTLIGDWQQEILMGLSINSFDTFEGQLYAATDHGLYRRPLKRDSISWISLGLQEKKIVDIVFLPIGKLLVATFVPGGTGEPSLFLSIDQGQNWEPKMANYGGEDGKWTWVESLTVASNPSDTLFARSSGLMTARSFDGGNSWSLIKGSWNSCCGAAVLLKIDPFYTGRLWIGGVSATSRAYLWKASNFGEEKWINLTDGLSDNVEAIAYDVMTHTEDPDLILVGLGGVVSAANKVKKSIDGGHNWWTVLEKTGVLTFARSIQNPNVIYASGRNSQGTLFFAASGDFGDTWQTVEITDGPIDIQVNDMISVVENGTEVLYFGTNKGMYSYVFEE